jgi:hypothetical protein
MLQLKLKTGEAVDVYTYEREGELYVFPEPPQIGMDYVDSRNSRWVWCIAMRLSDKKILASTIPSTPSTATGWRKLKREAGGRPQENFLAEGEFQILWVR